MAILMQNFSQMKTIQLGLERGPGHAGLQICHPDQHQILSQGVSTVQYLSGTWGLDETV
jgi:hypothetical protein